jgi:hypothetical protein
MSDEFRYSSSNWFGKASAGFLLGAAIALSLSSLFAFVGPGGVAYGDVQPQLVMWVAVPIWMLILGFCFLFRSGLRAWLWLGVVAIISFALLFAVKAFFPEVL